MNSSSIKSISEEVYRRFPEQKGTTPEIQRQKSSKPGLNTHNYVLIYRTRVNISSEKSLERIVRVVATEIGQIIKISTSH